MGYNNEELGHPRTLELPLEAPVMKSQVPELSLDLEKIVVTGERTAGPTIGGQEETLPVPEEPGSFSLHKAQSITWPKLLLQAVCTLDTKGLAQLCLISSCPPRWGLPGLLGPMLERALSFCKSPETSLFLD